MYIISQKYVDKSIEVAKKKKNKKIEERELKKHSE